MIIGIVKEAVHKKGQIDQKCAINCYIKGNVSTVVYRDSVFARHRQKVL